MSLNLGDPWPQALAIAADDSLTADQKRRLFERIGEQIVVIGSCGHPDTALVPRGSDRERADELARRFPCRECIKRDQTERKPA